MRDSPVFSRTRSMRSAASFLGTPKYFVDRCAGRSERLRKDHPDAANARRSENWRREHPHRRGRKQHAEHRIYPANACDLSGADRPGVPPCISPCSTVKLMLWFARMPVGYVLETFCTSIISAHSFLLFCFVFLYDYAKAKTLQEILQIFLFFLPTVGRLFRVYWNEPHIADF